MADACECQTPGCGKKSTLRCPTCVNLGLKDSYFCGQECFTKSWGEHKKVHKPQSTTAAPANNHAQAPAEKEAAKQVSWPGYKFTGPLRPYEQSPRRTLPGKIMRPDYADDEDGRPVSEIEAKSSAQIAVLTDEECEAMRVTGRLAREVIEECFKAVRVGVTTDEIDRICHEACVERECYPSPLNYYQFPKSCCTSINEVICHGIPDMRPLRDGDIVNIDVTVYHRGFHGDVNETVLVGQVDDSGKQLVRTAWECLDKAIEASRIGVRYREVGDVIQRHATAQGCSVVRTYCGHGVHRLFHCAPNVPHYAKNKAIGVMRPGHAFTIEPMINEGGWQDTTWPDDWTSVTRDGKRSAQFEHTLLVTSEGLEVLTRPLNGETRPYFMRQLENAV